MGELTRAVHLPETVIREEVDVLLTFGWVERGSEGSLRLTDEGRHRTGDLIRVHRLWERYLVDREGMALEAVHAEAHQREHDTTPEEVERLDAELEYPAWDPHGHAIPAPSGQLPSTMACSLMDEGTPGSCLRIIQLDDDSAELRDTTSFVAQELRVETPWHISRFFPAYEMTDVPTTPVSTLQRAREIGLEAGLKYVYVGNVPDDGNQDTTCPVCGRALIWRDGFAVTNRIWNGCCPDCGVSIAGIGMGCG